MFSLRAEFAMLALLSFLLDVVTHHMRPLLSGGRVGIDKVEHLTFHRFESRSRQTSLFSEVDGALRIMVGPSGLSAPVASTLSNALDRSVFVQSGGAQSMSVLTLR